MPGYKVTAPALDAADFERISAGDIASVLTRWQVPAKPVNAAVVAKRRARNKQARASRKTNRKRAK